ncbi:uncharacterized protein Dana_GF23867 [Drosophila ananassae]|uniref:RRM domain-containing protein n=1 Tax=Drosophila ananassae TaxID=7217 RepID=B3M4Y6_DROAN|nr:nuclear receptor coactivator 5 [Drosophila ananassae]EDV40560.1 uncharacterized protein Dana_GF23867 [Drosophila ananassae]
MTETSGYNITKDPELIKSRVFLGNIPNCTREELVSICLPYGKVLGSMVQKNYGFVQFETEEIANKAAFALHKSIFKSKQLTVRNASQKGKMPNTPKKNTPQVPPAHVAVPGGHGMPPVEAEDVLINDCEIIVVNRDNTHYAENIEDRLRNCGMRVDVLFPNEDVMLGKVLANISSRGCLYAVVVTPQHEALNSITVNILYGVPAEHRNMPLEDAITLIATDFRLKKQRDAVVTPAQFVHKVRRHPEKMQQLLNRLADNHPLTALQYECIIKYLEDERAEQLKKEVGEANAASKLKAPDPEIEQQKKILSIMNKPNVTEVNSNLLYSSLDAVKDDHRLMELLADQRVMAALESVYNSDVLQTVSEFL